MKLIINNVEFPFDFGCRVLKLKYKDKECPYSEIIDFWDEIEPGSWSGRKYVTLYWEHCRPELGIEVVKGNDPRSQEENSKYENLSKTVFSFESAQRLLEELEMLENL